MVKIEAKGHWHKSARTAITDQLRDYVQMTPNSAGIYLVYWPHGDNYAGPRRWPKSATPENAEQELTQQAASIRTRDGLDLRPFVLEFKFPAPR